MRFLKRLLIFTVIALVLGTAAAFGVLYAMPGFLLEWRVDRALMEAGAEFETVEVDGQRFEYGIGGDGEAIVFVHGFGGDKRMWTRSVAELVDRYRVVVVDLPGHGGSTRSADQTYTLDAMGEALGRFVDAADLPRFHLVGSSMGGGVALAYAIENPDRVQSLTLLNPWGVTTPEKSDREVLLDEGRNLFFPRTVGELDELSAHVYGTPMPLDQPFKEYLLERSMALAPFNHEVFDQMHAGPRLDDRLGNLSVPTMVVVGGADRIVHPSALETYQAKVPDLRAETLPGCAHVFVGPCFDRAQEKLEEFLKQ